VKNSFAFKLPLIILFIHFLTLAHSFELWTRHSVSGKCYWSARCGKKRNKRNETFQINKMIHQEFVSFISFSFLGRFYKSSWRFVLIFCLSVKFQFIFSNISCPLIFQIFFVSYFSNFYFWLLFFQIFFDRYFSNISWPLFFKYFLSVNF